MSSTPLPDELRCIRNDGRGWRCKERRFEGSIYCEKHYFQRRTNRKTEAKTKEHKEEVRKSRKRRRPRNKSLWCSSEEEEQEEEEEEEEIGVEKWKKVSEIDISEKYNISELVFSLKTAFQVKEFETVVQILKMREQKMKMEKQGAEKHAVHLKKELGIYEIKCFELSNELEEKKKELVAVEGKLSELEIRNISIQDELSEYNRMCDKLKTDNRNLESAKQRAENEIYVWKKRVKELETQILLETEVSRKVYVEPRGLAEVSYVEEGMKTESRQTRHHSETSSVLNGACLSHVKIKEVALNHDGRTYAAANVASICHSSARESGDAQLAGEWKKSASRQTNIQSETCCALNGASLYHASIKEEALNCDERVFSSENIDSVSHSSIRQSGLAQYAEDGKKSESKQTKIRRETSSAVNGAKLAHVKIKEEALNCDGTVYASANVDSICHSPVKESGVARSEEEVKKSQSRRIKIQGETNSAFENACLSHIKIKDEALNFDKGVYASDSRCHSSAKGS